MAGPKTSKGVLELTILYAIGNMQSGHLRENLMLCRTSLVGLDHIPTCVSALNSIIVFLF
jgi:hypothetical protein